MNACIKTLKQRGYELHEANGLKFMVKLHSYPPGSHVVFQGDRVVWWMGGRMLGTFTFAEAALPSGVV